MLILRVVAEALQAGLDHHRVLALSLEFEEVIVDAGVTEIARKARARVPFKFVTGIWRVAIWQGGIDQSSVGLVIWMKG